MKSGPISAQKSEKQDRNQDLVLTHTERYLDELLLLFEKA